MTHDEMIAVIEHHKNGGKVECCLISDKEWVDSECPAWDFYNFIYRIKKEPLRIYVIVNKAGELLESHQERQKAERALRDYGGIPSKNYRIIKLQEVEK